MKITEKFLRLNKKYSALRTLFNSWLFNKRAKSIYDICIFHCQSWLTINAINSVGITINALLLSKSCTDSRGLENIN